MKDLPLPANNLKRFRKRFLLLSSLVIAGVALIVFQFFIAMPGEFRFLLPSADGRTIEVKAIPRTDGTLKVRGIQDKTYSKIVLAEEFFKTPNIVTKVGRESLSDTVIITTVVLYICLPLLLIAIFSWDYRQNKKLMQVLSIPEETKHPQKKKELKAVF